MTALFVVTSEASCFICKKQSGGDFLGHQDPVTHQIQHIFHKACLLRREQQDPDVCLTCPGCETVLKYKTIDLKKKVLPVQILVNLAVRVALTAPLHSAILTLGGAFPVFMSEVSHRILRDREYMSVQRELAQDSIALVFFALGQSALVQKAKTKEQLFFLSCLTAGLIAMVSSEQQFRARCCLAITLALTQAVFQAVEKKMISKMVAPLIIAPGLYVVGLNGQLFNSVKYVCAAVPSLVSIRSLNRNPQQPKRLMRRYYDGLQVSAIFAAVIGGYLVAVEKVSPLVALPIAAFLSAGLGSFYVLSKASAQFKRSLS